MLHFTFESAHMKTLGVNWLNTSAPHNNQDASMSTGSPYGMFGFKVKRPLNDYEQIHHFDVKQRASDRVHYELSLIKLNSTFVEGVDKWYATRGGIAMAMTLLSTPAIYSLGGIWLYARQHMSHPGIVIALLMGLGLLLFCIYAFTRDAFTYTHYPIRFNRKNRQVYAFRRDGTVLKAGWEDLYWTIYGSGVGLQSIFVAGHVLSPNGQVQETIGLADVTAGREGEADLCTFFEFYRRYMEEGPERVLQALKPTPLIMLPGIHKKKESWRFGWERLTLHMNGWPILMILYQVFAFPESFFRWFVMRTSKIPQWPQWVEDECVIDPEDPWIRDERHAAK